MTVRLPTAPISRLSTPKRISSALMPMLSAEIDDSRPRRTDVQI